MVRPLVVYFSSVTNNTAKFVDKLPFDSVRLPLSKSEPPVHVNRPYVLITPTYGSGGGVAGPPTRMVPPQVIRFLNDPDNRRHIVGVIGSGNLNFGAYYGVAGDIVAKKCNVPLLHRFELMGNDEDVEMVAAKVSDAVSGVV